MGKGGEVGQLGPMGSIRPLLCICSAPDIGFAVLQVAFFFSLVTNAFTAQQCRLRNVELFASLSGVRGQVDVVDACFFCIWCAYDVQHKTKRRCTRGPFCVAVGRLLSSSETATPKDQACVIG